MQRLPRLRSCLGSPSLITTSHLKKRKCMPRWSKFRVSCIASVPFRSFFQAARAIGAGGGLNRSDVALLPNYARCLSSSTKKEAPVKMAGSSKRRDSSAPNGLTDDGSKPRSKPGGLKQWLIQWTPLEPFVQRENWTVPNALSTARMCSVPFLCYLLLEEHYVPAVGCMFLAGIADWFDGYIARKYNQSTVFGAFLDPMADKVMVAGLTVTFGYLGVLHPGIVGLIIARDVFLIAGATVLRAKTKKQGDAFFNTTSADFTIKPSLLSKGNTLLQFSLVGLAATHLAWGIPNETALFAIQCATGVTTLLSGAEYVAKHISGHSSFASFERPPTAPHAPPGQDKQDDIKIGSGKP